MTETDQMNAAEVNNLLRQLREKRMEEKQGQLTHTDGNKPLNMIPSLLVVPVEWLRGEPKPGIMTSLSRDTQAGRVAILKAKGENAAPAEEFINQELNVTDFLMHQVRFDDDETGEVVYGVRTVLLCADGKRVGFVSGGIVRSVMDICDIIGPAPWQPPLHVRLKQQKTSGSRSMFLLEYIA